MPEFSKCLIIFAWVISSPVFQCSLSNQVCLRNAKSSFYPLLNSHYYCRIKRSKADFVVKSVIQMLYLLEILVTI